MYKHFRKRDDRRVANLFELHNIEDSLVILSGIGEMFRAEGRAQACSDDSAGKSRKADSRKGTIG